ncbi:dihydrolipoyl dehydrogenase [Candidatus Enterococcus mangumiae]|uniref:Dihydrolipoyl dehydrogenase n=1 Tax=Candidatus Enterococcus mangumiae TaxID=2230878 RepID=A0ABZ2T198_9ENTE|nr:dihydrolipoyl dehydrogenase [Enterococcus sp. DIV1094]MBO0489727.1 dihydrolipoyl dehydrogenase [Enterococcus sp. DIV1094]
MKEKTETLVIGSGPGGYVAAIRAAQLGQQVTIVESKHIGGVCLNIGCIPSKALIHAGHTYQESKNSQYFGIINKETEVDFRAVQQWKENKVVRPLTTGIRGLLMKNKIRIIEGYARFTSPHRALVDGKKGQTTIDFDHAIIATGSRPIEIPGFKYGGRILDSTAALSLEAVPKKLVIIGGGVIGTELGSAYADLGAEVTILEGTDQLLPTYEKDLVQVVEESFKKKGIKVFTEALAKEVSENGTSIDVTFSTKNAEQTLSADYVLVTVGRKANTADIGLAEAGVSVESNGLVKVNQQYQTSQAHIYAIGDVIAGPALAHKASYDAKVAAEVISGKKVEKDYLAIPAICFTDPEIAVAGQTLAEAKSQGLSVKAATFPLQANGRALSLNAPEGFVRLIVEQETDTIVGGQIVGQGASDLIAEITLAIEANLTVEDIALTIHGHPTLSETIMDAAELALGLPIHL